jgi:hypothetical protein
MFCNFSEIFEPNKFLDKKSNFLAKKIRTDDFLQEFFFQKFVVLSNVIQI